MTTPFVVGAYAILPPERAEHGPFHAALPTWVTGLEIPWKLDVGLDPDPAWFAAQAARFTDSVLTLIPATMASISSISSCVQIFSSTICWYTGWQAVWKAASSSAVGTYTSQP